MFERDESLVDNISTTPLAAFGNYTGNWEERHHFANVTVGITCDVAGTLRIQFSDDQVNLLEEYTAQFDPLVPTQAVFQQPMRGFFFRLVYDNGGAPQTFFILRARLSYSSIEEPRRQLSDLSQPTDWSPTIRSALYAQDPLSGFVFLPAQFGPLFGILVEIPDGGDVSEGSTTDAGVVGDVAGTVSAKLRGINRILNDVWDDGDNCLRIEGNIPQGVAESGNPVSIGGRGTSQLPNALPDGDRIRAWWDNRGRLMQAGPNAQAEAAVITATGAAGAGVVATLPAAGAGLFHYISSLQIVMYASVAQVGAAAPNIVTTTNLSGPAFTFPTALPIGEIREQKFEPSPPMRSATANQASTIVCPAVVGVIWRVNVIYKSGVWQ